MTSRCSKELSQQYVQFVEYIFYKCANCSYGGDPYMVISTICYAPAQRACIKAMMLSDVYLSDV